MFLYTENLRRKNIVERTRRRGVKKSNVFFDFACFFSFLSIPVFNSIEEFLMNLYIYIYKLNFILTSEWIFHQINWRRSFVYILFLEEIYSNWGGRGKCRIEIYDKISFHCESIESYARQISRFRSHSIWIFRGSFETIVLCFRIILLSPVYFYYIFPFLLAF